MSVAALTQQQLQQVESCVREAGEIMRSQFGQLEGQLKGRDDVVTDCDLAVESAVKAFLEETFPGTSLLSEELGFIQGDGQNDWCWVLDPVDGTLNFAQQVQMFAISLALMEKGSPVAGWVFDPMHDEMFHAQKGTGAFLNGIQLSIPGSIDDGIRKPFGISSTLLDAAFEDQKVMAWLKELSRVGKIRNLGSQALHLCYVAVGRYMGCINWAAKLWDDAAGALIVQEAGGFYDDINGKPVFPIELRDFLQDRSIRSFCGWSRAQIQPLATWRP